MRRKVLAGLIVGLLILSLGGCKSINKAYEEAAATTFKVTVLKGPTAAGMIKMMEPGIRPSLKLGDTVEYVIEQSSDSLYNKLLSGKIEIAAVPTEMAAKLYNNGAKYQLAAINTGGIIYVLSNGVTIKKWTDLKGQEVHIVDKGAASDMIFRYLLSKNGVNPDKDLTLKYIASPAELAQLAITSNNNITVLPEPWVSMVLNKNSNVKIALDMQEEWNRINKAETPLTQTCLIVKAEVATKNPEELSLFLEDYANSIDWVNKNPDKSAQLVDKHNIGMPAEVAAKAIPRCNLLYMSAKDAKPAVEKYLQVLLDFSPDSIGGKLPDANFYYQKR